MRDRSSSIVITISRNNALIPCEDHPWQTRTNRGNEMKKKKKMEAKRRENIFSVYSECEAIQGVLKETSFPPKHGCNNLTNCNKL